MAKFETTQSQWARIYREGPQPSTYGTGSSAGGFKVVTDLDPVEKVSWTEVADAAHRWDLALPTEAQWEYAVRAGTTTPWWCGDAVGSLQGNTNIADVTARRTGWPYEDSLDDGHLVHAAVGSFAANPFGLYDMAGNVREWTADYFSSYASPPREGDGVRKPRSPRIVVRGSAFDNSVSIARSANRSSAAPDSRYGSYGFRVARGVRSGTRAVK